MKRSSKEQEAQHPLEQCLRENIAQPGKGGSGAREEPNARKEPRYSDKRYRYKQGRDKKSNRLWETDVLMVYKAK